MAESTTVAKSTHWSFQPGVNDLATMRPELVKEWHPSKNGDVNPSDMQAFSKKNVWWLGKCGHEWTSSPNLRRNTVGSAGCPFCCGKKVLIGFNDLSSQIPECLETWDYDKNEGLTPELVTAHSTRKVWWKCTMGHGWERTVCDQVKNKNTCPYCSGRRVLTGFNDLATTHPNFAQQWHPTKNISLEPTEISAGCNKRAWWVCDLGHEWNTQISSRMNKELGCPVCAGQQLLVGYNDLATTNPTLAAQWHPIKNGAISPQDISAGWQKNAWWIDQYGHEWRAIVNSRHMNNSGCPVCCGRKILIGFNDLATTNPTLAAQWHPTKNISINPQSVTQWNGKKAWWLGNCGHEWEATIGSRSNGRNCPHCVKMVSKIETEIYEAIKLTIPDIKQSQTLSTRWTKGNHTSVDMLIEDTKTVIEYDGSWWHAKKVDKDTIKSTALLNAGYTVIRIRHQPLPSLDIKHANYHEIEHTNQSTDELAAEVIDLITL